MRVAGCGFGFDFGCGSGLLELPRLRFDLRNVHKRSLEKKIEAAQDGANIFRIELLKICK